MTKLLCMMWGVRGRGNLIKRKLDPGCINGERCVWVRGQSPKRFGGDELI